MAFNEPTELGNVLGGKMERSGANKRLEAIFSQFKMKESFYICVWKESIEPKIQIHHTKPDPKYWFFIHVESVKKFELKPPPPDPEVSKLLPPEEE